MKAFIDNFSKDSEGYLKYRPNYPEGLFKYLSSVSNRYDLAWDCGTGNGQSALKLSRYFKKVYATDPSEHQINNALQAENIEFSVERAEESSLKDSSVNLITVAQAIHWFDFKKFKDEVDRVLAPKGIIAVWCYDHPSIDDEVDSVIYGFVNDILKDYWDSRNKMISEGYAQIQFPYQLLESPTFFINRDYSLIEFLGLLKSWSATKKYEQDKGESPLRIIQKDLIIAWGKKEKRKVEWDITLKVWVKPT